MIDKITIEIDRKMAEKLSHGLSDILCWTRGFMARSGPDNQYDPIGAEEVREMNIVLKRALE